MNLLAPDFPIFWSSVSAGVGILGIIAALHGWTAVSSERKKLVKARNSLVGKEVWEDAYPVEEADLSKWLRQRKIEPDSAIADLIRNCWAAWLGGRSASLTELHNLATRRERVRLSARFSAGVAAILLVIGIVGTLLSVHPILEGFKLKVSADAESVQAAESTNLVNDLVNNLGNAFLPSIAALAFTILVVSFRGGYTLTLHRFILELDRFAIGVLLPRYRSKSISQEYADVKSILSELAAGITARDSGFGETVGDLKALVDSIAPTIQSLEKSVENSQMAAGNLSQRSGSIAKELKQTLGKDSPLYLAVSGFEGIFERTNGIIESLSRSVAEFHERSQADREELKAVAADLAKKVERIGDDHRKGQENLDAAVSELKSSLTTLPDLAVDCGKEMVQQGLRELQENFADFRKEQKEKTLQANSELTRQITEKIDGLTSQAATEISRLSEAGKAIPKKIEQLDKTLGRQSEIEESGVAAIRAQADESKATIQSAKSEIDSARGELKAATAEAVAAFKKVVSGKIAVLEGEAAPPESWWRFRPAINWLKGLRRK